MANLKVGPWLLRSHGPTILPADASTSIFDASPTGITGPTTINMLVTAKNINGTPLYTGGDTVVFTTSASDTPSATVDNGDGTYTATLNYTGSTTFTVTANVNGVNIVPDITIVYFNP